MKILFTISLALFSLNLFAQGWDGEPEINWSGFLDVYYAYDFNKPPISERQAFLFNHNRHNEFNVNLALVRLQLNHTKYRANLSLQTGTYGTDNYAAEDDVMKNIFEANAGVSLNQSNTLWLDAGIFGSHLGFESAISMENPTLTRSLVAENSPYFLSGAKLTWTVNDKLEVAGVFANGWQRIRRVSGNSMLSFGTQFTYTASEKATFNWSTFVTTEDPDDDRRIMYFNNVYGLFNLTEKLYLIAGFDLGMRQENAGSNTTQSWAAPVAILRVKHSEKYANAFRFEYYNDPEGVIISGGPQGPFRCTGLSANFDYTPTENVAMRVEARWFQNRDPYFQRDDELVTGNFFIVGSLAMKIPGGK
jgi:hypothetical protein